MDFDFTEEQKMVKRTVRDFLEREIAPLADERERRGPLSREELVNLIKKLMPIGFYISHLPSEYGGLEADAITEGILHEESMRIWAGMSMAIMAAQMVCDLFRWSSGELLETLKERYLPRILNGEFIGCGALSEPNAGSDLQSLQTSAILDGDEYVINGTKTWITCGSIADEANVLAITDRSKDPAGFSLIMVEREASPFGVRELGHVGWRACPLAELIFENCRVPKRNIIGDPQKGYARIMQVFERTRGIIATGAAGISQAAIDASIRYAQQRVQFGRPLGQFQMIQDMIADMIIETEAARLLGYRALGAVDKGIRARMESAIAKAYATEAAVRVTSKAVQIHGAMGLSDEYPVERYFRDARMLTIPDGTTQMQKLMIGREAIGMRAFT
ncbi:acyl-CoA dehydrogenase family protein [Chloroflexota bacterium]